MIYLYREGGAFLLSNYYEISDDFTSGVAYNAGDPNSNIELTGDVCRYIISNMHIYVELI